MSRCGKAIDETLRLKKSEVTFEEWLGYAVFSLEEDLRQWPTMISLIHTLRERSPAMDEIRRLLYRRFLSNEDALKVNDTANEPRARFLAAEGALRHEGGSSYKYIVSFNFC